MKALAISCMLLAGCATMHEPQKQVETVTLKVLVPVPCAIEWPPEPATVLSASPGFYAGTIGIIRELEDTREYASALRAAAMKCSGPLTDYRLPVKSLANP